MTLECIHEYDGEVWYQSDFLLKNKAQLFDSLLDKIAWQQESYRMFGRDVWSPRLLAWYGDEQAVYTYSGKVHEPLPWMPDLLELRNKLQDTLNCPFNAVLLNLYRDGRDYMGWHADNEPELGQQPVIASLSLGAERLFRIQHKKSKVKKEWTLADGSLLVMRGELQSCWRHSIPKQLRVSEPRINLTFRQVYPR